MAAAQAAEADKRKEFCMNYLVLLAVCLIAASCGFKKYVYFISLGYGFSIAAEGIALLILFRASLTPLTAVFCLLLVVYGFRLGVYLLIRELKSASYVRTMKREIKDGSTMSMAAKCAIWISAALLYTWQVSPLLFRLEENSTFASDAPLLAGMIITILGLVLESASDLQKSAAKKKNPHRFVNTGLYRIVRCPNYFGEILIWTGVFVSGITALHGAVHWTAAILGYAGIIYVMFGGARRLEIRQNKYYGSDPEYQAYVKKTPILLPFIPLYSVEKYKWLVA